MAGTGYRPDEIDEIGFHDVIALLNHWSKFPPPAEAIRRIGEGLGIEKAHPSTKPAAPVDLNDPSGIGEMMANFPGGLVTNAVR